VSFHAVERDLVAHRAHHGIQHLDVLVTHPAVWQRDDKQLGNKIRDASSYDRPEGDIENFRSLRCACHIRCQLRTTKWLPGVLKIRLLKPGRLIAGRWLW